MLIRSVINMVHTADNDFKFQLYESSTEMLKHMELLMENLGINLPLTQRIYLNVNSPRELSANLELVVMLEYRDQMQHMIDGVNVMMWECNF